MASYPNLELIDYQFKELCNEFLEKNPEKVKNKKRFEIEANMFLQTFPNTATLFETPHSCSGQSFTSIYVTVFHEKNNELWGIFGDNRFAYMVYEPSEDFFSDLANHSIVCLGKAASRY